jgi:predicted nucleic acid-binding protein
MVEWLVGATGRSAFPGIYQALSDVPVLVPIHWALEISNALRGDLRSGRLSAEDFNDILTRFDNVDFRIQAPIDFDEIGPLARFAVAHDLTTYDATYVQVALLQGATLATLDNAKRRAATTLNIPLLPAAVP